MQYDYHSEYPVTLKYDPENGVTGVWYQNNMKGIEQMLEELEAHGHAEELNKIRQYMGATPDFAKKMEAGRRCRHLVANTKAMNAFHVVEIVGKVVFEPLSNVNWAVTGATSIEFEILNDEDPELDARYAVHLDGERAVGLSKWNGQAWVTTDEIIIPHNTDMHERFEGKECTTTPCK
jgi:hypothetical protein